MTYRDLLGRLRDASCLLEPSGCDGLLCGMLCANDRNGADTIGRELEVYYGLETALPGPVEALLAELRADVIAKLDSAEFEFKPLLPDDDTPMAARAEAFKAWCATYLHGLGVGGLSQSSVLTEQAREALVDISEFTRMEPMSDGGEDETEENERAYFELSEYLQVAVMLVREELRTKADGAPADQTIH